MYKKFLLLPLVALICACSQEISQDITTSPIQDKPTDAGQTDLTDTVLIDETVLSSQHPQTLSTYAPLTLNSDHTAEVIKPMISQDLSKIAVESFPDGSNLYTSPTSDRSAVIGLDPLTLFISLTETQYIELFSYPQLMTDLQVKHPETDYLLASDLSFTKEEAGRLITDFLSNLGISYELDFRFTTLRQDAVEKISDQDIIVESEKNLDQAISLPYDFYYVLVTPKIQQVPLFQDRILGFPELQTSVLPPVLEFIVNEAGIQSFYIQGIFPDSKAPVADQDKTMDLQGLIEKLPTLLPSSLDGTKTQVNQIFPVYIPQRKQDQLSIIPVWQVNFQLGDSQSYLLVDPVTYQEVE